MEDPVTSTDRDESVLQFYLFFVSTGQIDRFPLSRPSSSTAVFLEQTFSTKRYFRSR